MTRDRDDATNDVVRGHHCAAPHFSVSPDPLIDHGFRSSIPRSLPHRYDDLMFLEASLFAEPAVGPRYSPDSGSDDPISLRPSV
jgi:hypothetical protein